METKERGSRPAPQQRRSSGGRSQRPAVHYTDPRPFSGKRLVLRLVTVAAVTLAVLFGLSIFFKVDMEKITVAGAEKYAVEDVIRASGLRGGENLLSVSDARVSGRIFAKMPYVATARVGIKLPDTVKIEITELEVVYAARDDQGGWWLVSSQGRAVEQIPAARAQNYTRLEDVILSVPVVGGDIAAAPDTPQSSEPEKTTEDTPEETREPDGSEPETLPPVTENTSVSMAEKLELALSIARELENHGILGEAAGIYTEDPAELSFWYGDRFQVLLGDSSRLAYKLDLVKGAISQLGAHEAGELDVSFTTWPDKLAYTPFTD